MRPLQSPRETGELANPAMGWRWLVSLVTGPDRWQRYRNSLKRQIAERGPISEDAWQDPERLEVARAIERILDDCCWGERFRFHPDDPYVVVGEFEAGDLSEVEALIEIEKKYGIRFNDKEMESFLRTNPTFGQFVDLVIERKQIVSEEST